MKIEEIRNKMSEEKKQQTEQEIRVAKFQECYTKLVEEFQLDFTATIQPVMKIVDLKIKSK